MPGVKLSVCDSVLMQALEPEKNALGDISGLLQGQAGVAVQEVGKRDAYELSGEIEAGPGSARRVPRLIHVVAELCDDVLAAEGREGAEASDDTLEAGGR